MVAIVTASSLSTIFKLVVKETSHTTEIVVCFNGASPSISIIFKDIQDEDKLLCMAGAKGLSSLQS